MVSKKLSKTRFNKNLTNFVMEETSLLLIPQQVSMEVTLLLYFSIKLDVENTITLRLMCMSGMDRIESFS